MGDCYRNMLQEMTNCMTLMRGHQRDGPFDQGGVITTTLISNDLDNLLRRDVSAVTDHIKETALEAKFYPADKDFLDIGKLHLVNLETKTATDTPQVQVKISPKERQMVQVDDIITFPPPIDASKNDVDPDSIQVRRHNSYLQVPSPPCKKSLTLIKVVSLPYDVEGMAAVSHERVTVTYNNYDVGCSIVTASGVIYSHLKGRVKMASDTAFLSDGRSVVSHGGDLRVYNADGTPTNLRFRCQTGFDSCKISTDHWDNIYLVNGNSSIFVYHLGSANARRIISTSELTPRQICVTDSGLMVTSTCDILPSTVTVFDGDGRLGRSVRASHNGEYLYAATDGRNRVFVARVAESSRKLMVVVYTLWGTHLQEEVVLQEFQLSEKVSFLTSWCYLVCLAPNTLAFAHRNKLYFLRVPVPKA
ncbi:uncharacterized protein [Diadema antillarum]|uniref:uncharacterized protein n=1 Tax=Diadema antillarum TaxID=105358 RepID=UPI003A8817A3